MNVKFTIDTNGYPSHVRLMQTTDNMRLAWPIGPAEAIRLGGALIQAGQHLLNDESNRSPLIIDQEVDLVVTKRY